jgi:WD40 repeat protein
MFYSCVSKIKPIESGIFVLNRPDRVCWFVGRILSIAWHPTEDLIVTGGVDNIRIWSINSGHAVQRLTLGRQEKNKETIVWCVAVTR